MNYDYVGVGSALIGVIVWFVRLEGRIKNCESYGTLLEKELDSLSEKHDALDSKVLDELSKVRESLARIEGMFLIPANNKKERK